MPTTCLTSRKAVSRLKRSAIVLSTSTTIASESLQKYVRQPRGSSTGTARRITPPAGRQVARSVFYRFDRRAVIKLEDAPRPATLLTGPLGQADRVLTIDARPAAFAGRLRAGDRPQRHGVAESADHRDPQLPRRLQDFPLGAGTVDDQPTWPIQEAE